MSESQRWGRLASHETEKIPTAPGAGSGDVNLARRRSPIRKCDNLVKLARAQRAPNRDGLLVAREKGQAGRLPPKRMGGDEKAGAFRRFFVSSVTFPAPNYCCRGPQAEEADKRYILTSGALNKSLIEEP